MPAQAPLASGAGLLANGAVECLGMNPERAARFGLALAETIDAGVLDADHDTPGRHRLQVELALEGLAPRIHMTATREVTVERTVHLDARDPTPVAAEADERPRLTISFSGNRFVRGVLPRMVAQMAGLGPARVSRIAEITATADRLARYLTEWRVARVEVTAEASDGQLALEVSELPRAQAQAAGGLLAGAGAQDVTVDGDDARPSGGWSVRGRLSLALESPASEPQG
jgi:hypothetical protein